jgi:diguanylate cyclase (GGDEF)-like protein
MAILLFISQVYFIISFSLNSIGYVVYEYTISLFIFYFGVNSKKLLFVFLTQITTFTYFMMLDFKNLKYVIFAFMLNIALLIVVKIIKKLNSIKMINDAVFYVFFVLININSNFFFRREITILDIAAVIIGSLIIVYLWSYYINSQKEFLKSIDQKIYERNHDELTKLKNYRSLNEDLSIMDGNGNLTIVILDLDYFKKINDRFGHKVGNKALAFFSENLMTFLKNQSVAFTYEIYRYGGEEFLITFQTENIYVIEKLISNFQKYLLEETLLINRDINIVLNFSAGISMTKYASDYLRVINEADIALYQAKRTGRNKVMIFDFQD